MKKQSYKGMVVLALIMVFSAVKMMAQDVSDFTFNSGVRYSQWVTKSRLHDYWANTTHDGFAVYDAEGTKTENALHGKSKLDYVPGLVAKAIVENVQYYSQYSWAQSWAKPFFYSVADYGNYYYNRYNSTGGSLDDLNASKVFFGLYDLTKAGGAYNSDGIASTTKSNAQTALGTAQTGFVNHNTSYKISSSTSAYLAGHTVVENGWYHKSTYVDEMWLDGSYMGPALFAQLRNYNGSDIISDDWTIVYRQIQALWEMCWNSSDKLLYHAFAAAGHSNYSNTWSGFNTGSGVYHSASYWGRACGWYFLALIDILEQMDAAGLSGTANYITLKSHLTDLAAGLAARQDATGCWYQLLDENASFYADYYNEQSKPTKYNYLESSASALFAAGFLKAIRLGYISSGTYSTVAQNAYQGLVNNFFKSDGSEGVHLFGSCRSAGLGGTNGGMPRDGSKAYYLLGGDVARVAKSEDVTEGKILGAFILAATEYERLYQNNTVLFEKDLAPSYSLTVGDEISCPASGSGASITYQWYKDGVAVGGATSATIEPAASGNYYCTATSGGTTVTSSTSTVTVSAAYSVTYHGNGNTGGTDPVDASSPYISGSNVTVLSAGTLVKSGYTFNGWNTQADGLGTPYSAGGTISGISADIDLYAQWTEGEDDELFSWTSKTDISNTDISAGTYTFTPAEPGTWLASVSGGTVQMVVPSDGNMRIRGSQLAFNSNNSYFHITLNSALAEGDKIDINSSGNTNNLWFSLTSSRPGSAGAAAAVVVQGTTYTIPAESSLIGETDIYIWRNTSTTQLGTFTITRSGGGGSTYTVNYTAGDGGTCATLSDTYTGSPLTLPSVTPNSSAGNYQNEFKGWYTAVSEGTRVGGAGDSYSPTGDIELFAQYSTNYYISTSVVPAGGGAAATIVNKSTSAAISSGTYVPAGTVITVTAGAANSGYAWNRWSNGTNNASLSFDYTVERIKTFIAYYTTNTAITPSSAAYTVGDTPSSITYAPTLSPAGDGADYQWYKNSTNSAVVDNEHKIDGATSATLAAAKIDTGSEGTTYYYCVVTPTYDTGSKSGTSATSNIVTVTVSAAVATTYTVTYNANLEGVEGSVPTDATAYAEGATVTVKGNTGTLEKSGYTFLGWSTASGYQAS